MENRKHNEEGNTQKDPPVSTAAPPEPKPYPAPGYPKVVFNKAGNAPPRIVNNDDELNLLDPKLWTQIPPVEPKEQPTWPKLYGNVNVPPKLIANEAEADALGPDWVEFPLPKPVPAAASAHK